MYDSTVCIIGAQNDGQNIASIVIMSLRRLQAVIGTTLPRLWIRSFGVNQLRQHLPSPASYIDIDLVIRHYTFMQCQKSARLAVCGARNAYEPRRALQVAFFSTSRQWRNNETDSNGEEEDGLISPWEVPAADYVINGAHLRNNKAIPAASGDAAKTVNPAVRWRRTFDPPPKHAPNSSASAAAGAPVDYAAIREASISDFRFFSNAQAWKGSMMRLQTLARSIRHEEKARRPPSPSDAELYQEARNYAPLVVMPLGRSVDRSEDWSKVAIGWMTRSCEKPRKTLDFLNKEIENFANFMKATPVEKIARQAVADEVMTFIEQNMNRDIGHGYEIGLFGSESTGLSMPFSDIDIKIFPTEDKNTDKRETRVNIAEKLWQLYGIMRQHPEQFKSIVLRTTGDFPLVSCIHVSSGLDIQIVSSEAHTPQDAITRKYLDTIPNLLDMFIVVRTFFEVRGLVPVFNGGLGSYAIFSMLVACLTRPSTHAPEYEGLVGQLMRFLAYFDPTHKDGIRTTERGISCNPPYTFKKHGRHPTYDHYRRLAEKRGDAVRAGQWKLCQASEDNQDFLCIQDPADPTNDLGKKGFAIRHILATIAWYRAHLDTSIETHAKFRGSYLRFLMGRPDMVYAKRRERLTAYGKEVIKRLSQQSKYLKEQKGTA